MYIQTLVEVLLLISIFYSLMKWFVFIYSFQFNRRATSPFFLCTYILLKFLILYPCHQDLRRNKRVDVLMCGGYMMMEVSNFNHKDFPSKPTKIVNFKWFILFIVGLALLLPFLLSHHHLWRNCKLCIFTAGSTHNIDSGNIYHTQNTHHGYFHMGRGDNSAMYLCSCMRVLGHCPQKHWDFKSCDVDSNVMWDKTSYS